MKVNIYRGVMNSGITVEGNFSIWCSLDKLFWNMPACRLLILTVVPVRAAQ